MLGVRASSLGRGTGLMDKSAIEIADAVWALVIIAFFLSLCAWVAYLAYEAIYWLKYDITPPWTVGMIWTSWGFGFPETGFLGLDHIIYKFMSLPLGEGMLAIPLSLVVIGVVVVSTKPTA